MTIEDSQRLTRIEEQNHTQQMLLEQINHRLFGNGQPGVIKDLQVGLQAEEAFTSKAKGAIAVLGIVVAGVGGSFWAHLAGWMGGK